MTQVSKNQFFDFIRAYAGDVMPRSEPDRSDWVDQRSRRLVGISTPGYMCRGPEKYFIKEIEEETK